MIKFTEQPFNLIGKTGKWDSTTNKYINKYEGTLINDRLWVVCEPKLNEEREKKDGTKYRTYESDSFIGRFNIGLIIDNFIIGCVDSSWYGNYFEFQNDANTDKLSELENKWINDGCLIAIRIKGDNMKRLSNDFKDTLFMDDLIIVSESNSEFYELIKKNYESFKDNPDNLSKYQIKNLRSQGLYIEIIDNIDEYQECFDGLSSEYDFINIIELVDEFNEHAKTLIKDYDDKSKKGNGNKSNYSYQPEKKLEFIKTQLKECGFKGKTIKDVIQYGKESKENWFSFLTILGISGSYMPRYEFPFEEGNKPVTDVVALVEKICDNQIDSIAPIETTTNVITDNNDNVETNNEIVDLLKHSGVLVLEDLINIPGQIPKDFDIKSAINNGELTEEWLEVITDLSEVVDLTSRSVKTKMKRIKKDAISLINLDIDELTELKKQIV